MEKIIDEIKKIKRVEYARGYQDGLLAQKHFEEQFEKVAKAVAEEPAQEKRDRIVERAKKDLRNLGSNRSNYDVVYHVNRTKGAVVAVVKGVFTGNIHAKGIAKCAPSDCFNEYIGKAIALRRALGLTIPEEYLNAPNPTEVRVGNILLTYAGYRNVVSIGREVVSGKTCQVGSRITKYKDTKIIDDSESIKEGAGC